MIPNLEPLTISGDTLVPLIDVDMLASPSPGSNSYGAQVTYSLTIVTNNPVYIGNSEMTRDNCSVRAAGTIEFKDLRDNEFPCVLPQVGQTVVVHRFGQGFKGDEDGNYGYDLGGYGD